MSFIYNQPLKSYNTFGIEVNAKRFAAFKSIDELKDLLVGVKTLGEKLLVLGGGSNVLFTGDFDGIVLRNEIPGIEKVREDDQFFYLKAGAGVVWHAFVMHCVENNYQGIENLSLIPGSVGAAPMQNIGAYGVELKDVFHVLEAVEIATGEVREFDLKACEFGYRESIFKGELREKYVIVSVTLRLNKQHIYNVSYGNIKQQLEANGVSELSIQSISKAVIEIRQSKLPDPALIGNAGSFFKNPEIPKRQFEELKTRYPDAVGYPVNDATVKVAAGWLIEKAGWKGKTFGNYGVHKNQALVLVNYGGAGGQQVLDLSSQIIDSVYNTFGVKLNREVNIV